jgi:hypothetical protein
VVEHEDLIAQHREPIEVLGPLLMSNGRHGGLEPGDVRLERDRDLIPESPLHSRADRSQEPRRRRRHSEP